MTAKMNGFRNTQSTLQVLVGSTASQDLNLFVGASQDSIIVKSTASILRSGETSQSYVLDRPMIEGLPLNGRRYTD